jgi:hypothetical protein
MIWSKIEHHCSLHEYIDGLIIILESDKKIKLQIVKTIQVLEREAHRWSKMCTAYLHLITTNFNDSYLLIAI